MPRVLIMPHLAERNIQEPPDGKSTFMLIVVQG